VYRITKQFTFAASHILHGLPAGHKCGRLHGHNYVVEIELSADTLDASGFIVDYGDLRPFEDWLQGTFDHRHLNDILPMQPSAENLARYLYEGASRQWPQVTAIRVSETPKTWAEYRRDA
jgi:6-pyruvoyltetrahydropterin/6-carboxytetrahydropterin synthase